MNNYSYVSEVHLARESEFFKYDIKYPVLKLYPKYCYHDKYEQSIIDSINNEIYIDVMNFKNNVKKQAIEYKKLYTQDFAEKGYVKYQYEVYITYEVTYDKNDIMSIIMTEYEFTGGAHGMTYLVAYNYNLLTGEKLTLKDMFKKGVDYKEVVNKFIKSEIDKNPDIYFTGDEGFKGISDNQPFYITNNGIVIYFGLYEIAPYYVGIPKFTLKFRDFNEYLNI